jgi:hypothetical protein
VSTKSWELQGGPLVFSSYTSSDAFQSVPGTSTDWESAIDESSFGTFEIVDLTEEWRRIMRAKYERRWTDGEKLRGLYGAGIEPELQVSSLMLGIEGSIPFIDSTARTMIIAYK